MTDPVAATRTYLDSLFGDEDSILRTVRAHMKRNKLPPISIHPRIGRLLSLLVRISGARRILEIGTLGGISTIYLARALPSDGHLLAIDKSASSAAVAKKSFQMAEVEEKIELVVADALTLLPQLEVEPFDLVYLDAEKSEYPAYLEAALPLMRKGTVLIADDVLRRGKPVEPKPNDPTSEGLINFNARLARDLRFESLILPDIADYSWGRLDGIAIARLQ